MGNIWGLCSRLVHGEEQDRDEHATAIIHLASFNVCGGAEPSHTIGTPFELRMRHEPADSDRPPCGAYDEPHAIQSYSDLERGAGTAPAPT